MRGGTTITFGRGWQASVSAEQYRALLTRFAGDTVSAGTSRTDPPAGSLGEWLQENVTKVAIASYVAPILIAEGYAEALHGPHLLRFGPASNAG